MISPHPEHTPHPELTLSPLTLHPALGRGQTRRAAARGAGRPGLRSPWRQPPDAERAWCACAHASVRGSGRGGWGCRRWLLWFPLGRPAPWWSRGCAGVLPGAPVGNRANVGRDARGWRRWACGPAAEGRVRPSPGMGRRRWARPGRVRVEERGMCLPSERKARGESGQLAGHTTGRIVARRTLAFREPDVDQQVR